MELLRIGLIGAGAAARSIHLPGLRLCPQVEIAAVCDPDLAAARSLGVSRTFDRVEDLLSSGVVDAVVVATPNYLHHEIAGAALAAGKHVAHDPRWGYRYDQAWQFVESVRQGKSRAPTFADGARCQAVLDAALASSETRSWAPVGQDRILQADSQSAFSGLAELRRREQEAD